MKNIDLGKLGKINASAIALGCMRISGKDKKDVQNLISTALDCGINFFDHADIYGGGKSEEVFASAFNGNRDSVLIQSKCGIRPGFFDFSKEHIVSSVEKSLKRLNTDYLDILLLHRPDTLMEPEEVAEAFTTLEKSGKVRFFGVSNQNPYQMALLQKYLPQKIVANQLQFGLAHTGMIDCGITVNMKHENGINRDGSVLEYCRLNDITIQAWSPVMYGFFEGIFIGSDKYPELNKELERIGEQKGVSPPAVAI
ncbi:MAG: aldo/keto reductase family oxidoreductase, partial [Ruminococcaceae bacterium]|nr:aldo/keto reductase family oxidoreductase [Oscillospiraceae bacterium]